MTKINTVVENSKTKKSINKGRICTRMLKGNKPRVLSAREKEGTEVLRETEGAREGRGKKEGEVSG